MSFDFDFTREKLAACIYKNKNPDPWYDALSEHLPTFEIVTPARVAGFIAQCQHESLDFTLLQENLNYSAKGLNGVFKKYFPTMDLAESYQRQPEKIANRVYGSRMGNGDESSGDGFKFRGRGLIQLTGRNNYTMFSREFFGDDHVVEDPDLVRTPPYAVLSACWFWNKNGLNRWCDEGDIVTLSKRINGGTIGLDDRISHWNHCLEILEG
jgi:putative chitinase